MPEMPQELKELYEWITHNETLFDHILNGVARGLYPEHVAMRAFEVLRHYNNSTLQLEMERAS